jgi:hypothetical protein
MTVTEVEAPATTHDVEKQAKQDEQLKQSRRDPPSDCPDCHTGRTRACPCGGRIHNEMQDRLVEQCFSCGFGWVTAK